MAEEHIEGLRELEAKLKEMPKAVGKGVLRRVLKRRGEPVAEAARGLVRVDEGDLKASIGVGTKLTGRQARLHRRSADRSTVDVFVGAGGLTQAITEEFGTDDQAPHPFLRPAWDGTKRAVLDGIGKDLWDELEKTAKRRAARAASRGE